MYRTLLLIFIFIFSLISAGCTRQQLTPTITLAKFQEETAASHISNNHTPYSRETLTPAQAVADDNDISDYILGPGDLITVKVFETSDLNTETRISSRGDITMPLLGNIHIQDLTAREAEQKIEQALTKNYMRVAHVTLFVKERMDQNVTVVGAVKHPGTFDMPARKRLMACIAMAGGLSDSAGDTCYVTRKNNRTHTSKVFLVDLNQLINNGQVSMDILIHRSDIIFVPQSNMVQVDGAVRKPGAYKIDGEMTIDGALAAAGGLAMYADANDIKLIRKKKDGTREILQLSMKDIIAMKKNQNTSIKNGPWHNLLLQNGDVIFAEASGSRTFYSGVGFNLGFLGTGISYRAPRY